MPDRRGDGQICKGSLFADMLPPRDILAEIASFLSTRDVFNLVFCCKERLLAARTILAGRRLECAGPPAIMACFGRVWLGPEVLRRCLGLLGVHLSAVVGPHLLVDGSVANLAVLRERGLTLEHVRADRNIVLRIAADEGRVEVLRFLRGWGLAADDARADKNGALRRAAMRGHLDVLLELREWGLTAEDARAEGNFALVGAVLGGRWDVMQVLRGWGLVAADARAMMRDWRAWPKQGRVLVVQELCRWGLAAEEVRAFGVRLLFGAIKAGDAGEVWQLCEWGLTAADARAEAGAALGRVEIVQMLRRWVSE